MDRHIFEEAINEFAKKKYPGQRIELAKVLFFILLLIGNDFRPHNLPWIIQIYASFNK